MYTIRGKVGQGDSGGPLIDTDGRVLGMNFGAAVDDPETGFVLTAKQVYPHAVNAVAVAAGRNRRVRQLTAQRPGIGRTNTDS